MNYIDSILKFIIIERAWQTVAHALKSLHVINFGAKDSIVMPLMYLSLHELLLDKTFKVVNF